MADRSPLPSLHQALNSPHFAATMDSLLIKARPAPAVVAAAAASQPIEPRIPTPVRLSCDGPPPALHRLPPRDGNHVFGIASTTGGGATSLERLVQDLSKLHHGRLRSQVVSVHDADDGAMRKKRRRLLGDEGGSDGNDSDDQLPLSSGESTPSSPMSWSSSSSSSTLPPLSWFSYPFKFPTLTTTMRSSWSMAVSTSSSSTSSSSTSSTIPTIAAAALSPASSPPRFTSFSATHDPFVEQAPSPPKKKRKPRVKITGRVCAHCGAVKTSEWRMGPEGRGTLCNACGLRYRKKLKAESQQGQGHLQTSKIPLSMLLNSCPALPPSHLRSQRRTPEQNNNNDDGDDELMVVRGRPTATGRSGEGAARGNSTGNFAAAIA